MNKQSAGLLFPALCQPFHHQPVSIADTLTALLSLCLNMCTLSVPKAIYMSVPSSIYVSVPVSIMFLLRPLGRKLL